MTEWRSASYKDKRLLQAFTCADPAGSRFDPLRRMRVHSEPWADEVQRGLRNWKYHASGAEMWLGFEGDELVSVGAYVQSFDQSAPLDVFQIGYVANAFGWRGRGLGDLCLGQLLADIRLRTEMRDGVLLTADVHEKNTASKALFQRFGFERADVFTSQIREGSGKRRPGGQYGIWVAQF